MVKECNITADTIKYTYSDLSSALGTRENYGAHYEILFVTEGEARLFDRATPERICRGMLLLFPKDSRARILPEPESPIIAHSLRFTDSDLVADTLRTLERITAGSPIVRQYALGDLPVSVISVFERLSAVSRLFAKERTAYLRLMLSELVLLLSLATPRRVGVAESELGARVREYIDANIESDLSLDNLSGIFFVSKCHLCRAFKRYTDRSVHAYVSERRVGLARRLIESGETAADAAYKVGFGDYSAFYRAYVKFIGKSPSDSADIQGQKKKI